MWICFASGKCTEQPSLGPQAWRSRECRDLGQGGVRWSWPKRGQSPRIRWDQGAAKATREKPIWALPTLSLLLQSRETLNWVRVRSYFLSLVQLGLCYSSSGTPPHSFLPPRVLGRVPGFSIPLLNQLMKFQAVYRAIENREGEPQSQTASMMTLDKWLSLSKPQFPYL